MTDDRDLVLSKIRVALRHAHLPDAPANLAPRLIADQADPTTLIESFCRELEPLGGKTFLASSEQEATDLALGLLRECGGNEILAWDDSELVVPELGAAIRRAGFSILDAWVPQEPSARRAKFAELERAAAGITGAFAGLADTGSLALLTSPTRSRLASLLPPTHIALLPTNRLYATMALFFAAHPNLFATASNLVFVTGPSRTADIELTLTRGVHGPRDLYVILLSPNRS